jgi:hypothetical protein
MLLAFKRLGSRYRKFRETVRSQILPRLNCKHDPFKLCVADHKKSDTLYVLATGSSINYLPDAAWDDIHASDSLGINFWLYHEHVPTWLSFEISRTPADAATMLRVLEKRLPDYHKTAFLLKDINKLDERYPRWHQEFPLSRIHHCYTLFSTSVRGRTESSLRRSLRWSRRLGLFAKQDMLWALPMKRATIFLAMSFGLMAGYKRIVLCGVDLNNAAYFYDDESYQNFDDLPATPGRPNTTEDLVRRYSNNGVKMRQAPNPNIHNTIDPALNPLPMDAIIHAFNEEVLKHMGVELFVALPTSKLFPRIPAIYHSANKV